MEKFKLSYTEAVKCFQLKKLYLNKLFLIVTTSRLDLLKANNIQLLITLIVSYSISDNSLAITLYCRITFQF